MLAMSTIIEGKAPFEVCFGYSTVLGEDGRVAALPQGPLSIPYLAIFIPPIL
jgi:hypothetical protein